MCYHFKIRTGYTGYILLKVKKYYNVMIDGKNLFDHPVKNDLRTNSTFKKLQLFKKVVAELVAY